MGQIKFLVSLAFIVVFTLAVVSYGVGFANDNVVAVSITNNSDFSGFADDLSSKSKTGFDEINSSALGFEESELDSQDFAFRTGGTLKQFGRNSSILAVFSTLDVIQNTIFGGKDGGFGTVFNWISALLLLISAMYVYKTWIGRNPD